MPSICRMIKAVIFDWGGVLIDEPSEAIFSYFAEHLNVDKQSLRDTYRKYNPEFQKGNIKEDEVWERVCSELNIEKPRTPSLWYDALKNAYTPKKEMFALVEQLKKNGYKTGFLSNTEAPAMKFFNEQAYDMFDAAVFSCSEGKRKPEKEIYMIILDKLGVAPNEAVLIDDKKEMVEGASNVGIYSILFIDPGQSKQALRDLSVNID